MTGTAQYVVLFPFVLTAAVLDGWRKTIPNKLMYPGIVLGIVLNAIVAGTGATEGSALAAAGRGALHGLLGFLLCGGVMLVMFVLFPIGGGDVKLIAMIGAFLGMEHGLEAMLWTFVLGAVLAIAALIWQQGAVELLRRACRFAWLFVRTGGRMPMTEDDREPLRQELFLAVAALLAFGVLVYRRGLV